MSESVALRSSSSTAGVLSTRGQTVWCKRPANVPNEDVLDTAEMWVFELLQHDDVVELNVEVLIDGFEGAADRNVVLKLNGHSCSRTCRSARCDCREGKRQAVVIYGSEKMEKYCQAILHRSFIKLRERSDILWFVRVLKKLPRELV